MPLTNSNALLKERLIKPQISSITPNAISIYSETTLIISENLPPVLLSSHCSALSKTCLTASQTIENMSIRLFQIVSAAPVIFSHICDKLLPRSEEHTSELQSRGH